MAKKKSPKGDLISKTGKVTERFTRVSDDVIDYQFEVSDPVYYTQAWTGQIPLRKSKERIFEYACHEGNYALPGILRGDALYLCETEIDVSIIGIGSGDNTTSLCRLPAKFALERVERMTITAPDGDGEYNDSVGFTGSTYDDILANNPYPFADTWGLASAEWGSGFADGYSYDASARTLVYLINGFNQTVSNTVGSVRVRIAGRYFGS